MRGRRRGILRGGVVYIEKRRKRRKTMSWIVISISCVYCSSDFLDLQMGYINSCASWIFLTRVIHVSLREFILLND